MIKLIIPPVIIGALVLLYVFFGSAVFKCSFPSKTQKTDKQNPKKSGEMFHLSEAPHRFYHV